jgi:hypothetical protein
MARAVAAALRSAKPPASDKAAVELAKRYAALLDDAAVNATYVKPLRELRAAVALAGTPAAQDALVKLETALSAHSVASDLGPKLLAALTALGLTAAGRGGVKGGGSGVGAVAGKLDELRERRERRRRGAGAD